jgi:hypothetical protein
MAIRSIMLLVLVFLTGRAAQAEVWSENDIFMGLILTHNTMARDAFQCVAAFHLSGREAEASKAFQVGKGFFRAALKLDGTTSVAEQNRKLSEQMGEALDFAKNAKTNMKAHCEELIENPKKVWAEYFYTP